MKKFLDINNPIMQFLAMIGNLFLLNFLFLVCCLPVVTVGASLAAMNKIAQDIVTDREATVVKPFFSAFVSNFKQATILWLIVLAWVVAICANALVAMAAITGNTAVISEALIGVVAVFTLAVLVYLFPLIVRFQNSLKGHFKNALILAVTNFPRTFLLTLLNAVSFLVVMNCTLNVVLQFGFYWLLIGPALVCYLTNLMLRPVFARFEPNEMAENSLAY